MVEIYEAPVSSRVEAIILPLQFLAHSRPLSPDKMAAQNGSAEAPIEVSSLPNVVGINFGNSYASIAVLNKEGQADCIANEDGERQIACAISFLGEQIVGGYM